MRTAIVYLLAVLALSACAGAPQAEPHAAFQTYWRCAYGSAMNYASDRRLGAREAAMRAQAQCYPAYQRYKSAQERYSRSVVTSVDRDMAAQLADREAFQRKTDVTARLTRLVAQARE